MSANVIKQSEYKIFFSRLKQEIITARQKAYKGILKNYHFI